MLVHESGGMSLFANSSGSVDAMQDSWNFLSGGGLFMIPLAFTSVIGLMAILYKFLSLSPSRVIPPQLGRQIMDFDEHVRAGKHDAVIREIDAGNSTLSRLAHLAFRLRHESQSDILMALEAASRKEAARLHAGISILDVVITVAPLLGLLGTASGLVTIFQGLGDNYDAAHIARGIAIALNTTIFGLAIAVPCVVAHGYFTRRIDVLSAQLESMLSEFVRSCRQIDTSR